MRAVATAAIANAFVRVFLAPSLQAKILKQIAGSRNAECDFHAEKRKNATHSSATDPRARLFSEFVGLPVTWWRRASFRTKLREDLEGGPEFLRDIGIDICEAQTEAMRFFWEPVRLRPR